MPVPLVAAGTAAAAAGLAYLNAKHSIHYDWFMFKNIRRSLKLMGDLDQSGRHNVFFTLEQRALDPNFADRTYLVYNDRSWTFRETYDQAVQHGTWLKQQFSVKPGEVIAMDWTNNDRFLWLWFGLSSIGAKPAFINHNLTNEPLVHCIKTSTARIVLVDPDVEANLTADVRSALDAASIQIVVLDSSSVTAIAHTRPIRAPDSDRLPQQGRDLGMLIFTSGTTGLPKAAWVSWNKVNRAGIFTSGLLSLTPEDRFLTVMPLYHSAASILGAFTCLYAGCTLVLGRKFSPRTYMDFVRASDATVIQYVGETCRYMLSAPPSPLDTQNRVRLAYGNGLRPDIWEQFKTRFGIPEVAEFYAATEGPGALYNVSRGPFSAGAIGRSGSVLGMLFGSTSAIVRVDDATDAPWRDPATGFCVRVDRTKGEPGEMLNALPEADTREAFQGYFGNDKATDGKILRNVFRADDAWYRTGDLIRATPDGLFYFHDRIGDTFRWKSENVSTNEVSEALGRHAAVAEANVYGVQLPRHDGRAGCAATVLKEGASVDDGLLQGLAQLMAKSLPRYAVPVFIRFTDKLEATGTNKHMKHVLREQGVDPAKVAQGDRMFWLKGKTYVPFEAKDWEALCGGSVRL